MARARAVMGGALVALVVVGLPVLGVAVARADEETIEIVAGGNVVTWNGAAPYPITSFVDTPIASIHRFDAVRQKWLSRVVGREDSTLPELHLLPRVQYLLVAEAGFDLVVPDPISGVDPLAELRFPAAPDDPLRFEAYWPNEDSPLGDLVVLRGEDERLSVEAWVAGGVGEVEVYWFLDGRLNHQGAESDDVELLPGKHNNARLFAADEMGQVISVELPRVVKLPPLDLPEMHYGTVYHYGKHFWNTDARPEATAEMKLMKEAGFTITMGDFSWLPIHPGSMTLGGERPLPVMDWMAGELDQYGLDVIAISQRVPWWAAAGDLTNAFQGHWSTTSSMGPWRDPLHRAAHQAWMAERWPSIRFWNIAHESNFHTFYSSLDAVTLAAEIKAAALGTWYANPDAIIVAPGLVADEVSTPAIYWHYTEFLQALYDHGAGAYIDIVDVHPFQTPQQSLDIMNSMTLDVIDKVRAVMTANGDADKPLWATSVGTPTWARGERVAPVVSCTWRAFVSPSLQADMLVATYQTLAERDDVSAVLSYNFRDTNLVPDGDSCDGTFGMVWHEPEGGELVPKTAYWAIREFITGKPPPE